jgi:hypothetical protein
MKMQLQDASLRLRLSEAEFTRLLDGESVLSRTPLPGGALVFGLGMTTGEAFAFAGALPALNLLAPRTALLDYQQRLPCREGIETEVETGDGRLAISLEVDVRDSVRTRGPKRKAAP